MTNLSPLIEQIEAAEEGDFELDNLLLPISNRIDHYTTSIDAIVSLVESVEDIHFSGIHAMSGDEWIAGVGDDRPNPEDAYRTHEGTGHTPALALCAAFLKTIQSERGEG